MKNKQHNHAESQKAGRNLASEAPQKNTSTEQQDNQQGKGPPVELSAEQEIGIMRTSQANLLKAMEDPVIFEAFLLQEKRAIVGRDHAVFLRNLRLRPEQKKQFIDLLAEKAMAGVQATYLADISSRIVENGEELRASLAVRNAAKADAEAEISGKIAALLGEELNARYLDFIQSKNSWKEMDKFALNVDPTAPPLSDDQKAKVVNLLKTSEVKNIAKLGDKMNEVLSADQMAAYRRYVHEEDLLALAKETRKAVFQKSDALRQELENSQK